MTVFCSLMVFVACTENPAGGMSEVITVVIF